MPDAHDKSDEFPWSYRVLKDRDVYLVPVDVAREVIASVSLVERTVDRFSVWSPAENPAEWWACSQDDRVHLFLRHRDEQFVLCGAEEASGLASFEDADHEALINALRG